MPRLVRIRKLCEISESYLAKRQSSMNTCAVCDFVICETRGLQNSWIQISVQRISFQTIFRSEQPTKNQNKKKRWLRLEEFIFQVNTLILKTLDSYHKLKILLFVEWYVETWLGLIYLSVSFLPADVYDLLKLCL